MIVIINLKLLLMFYLKGEEKVGATIDLFCEYSILIRFYLILSSMNNE